MNTIFLRLEGPLQSWGISSSFVTRRSGTEPSKSGVTGLLCACAGLKRNQAQEYIQAINQLRMGVRADREGTRMIDYQTVSSLWRHHQYYTEGLSSIFPKKGKKADPTPNGKGLYSVSGEKTSKQTEEVYKEYLQDASFLVALQGNEDMIARLAEQFQNPVWPLYLGRKSCPPARRIFAGTGNHQSLEEALLSVPWKPRQPGDSCRAVIEIASEQYDRDCVVQRDVLKSLIPHVLDNRLVKTVNLSLTSEPEDVLPPENPKPNYSTKYHDTPEWRARRWICLQRAGGQCESCGMPATEAHHITYQRFFNELPEDLRAMCRMCHEIVSAVETELNLGNYRLDPRLAHVRQLIMDRIPIWKEEKRR